MGINFSNSKSVSEIMKVNYEAKITKAKSWVKIWNRRDLTLLGKVTIIKSLIYSQFSYLALPMIKPSSQLIKNVDTLTFNFLWGGKRDKIKREVVKRPISEGGLALFDFEEFLISLKLTWVKKLLNPNFSHNWKGIILKQLNFPDNVEIAVKNALTYKKYTITKDVLDCYTEWKEKVSNAKESCINHVVWSNKKITDIGSRLWNGELISRKIYYISDFINVDYSIMTYDEFRVKWNIDRSNLSSREYVDIKMAIRNFNCSYLPERNITRLDSQISLLFFKDNIGNIKDNINGKIVRKEMATFKSPNNLPALKQWSRDLDKIDFDWSEILNNIFTGITNNFKLIQFQYKLLMRISTCKYMRYKMRIARDSDQCSLCGTALETLAHIFLYCPQTIEFRDKLKKFIIDKIYRNYRDPKSFHFLTCSHHDQIVNYINLTAKWYMSRNFQNSKPLIWEEFMRFTKLALTGEKHNLRNFLKNIIG